MVTVKYIDTYLIINNNIINRAQILNTINDKKSIQLFDKKKK